ncbi:MAG: DUF4384 domain-containing protein [Pseudorhodoplanes sp.]|uniref:DUF4384 domain-containing protein n=1 Tax=Pseudorhodoplanes sp. TaxID=1934341 RepID=UPI003D144EF2
MSGRQRVSSPVRGLAVAAVFGLGLTFAGVARAEVPPPPADPIAKAAYDVLLKHCARCHQDGALSEKDLDNVEHTREKSAANFSNVLNLEEVAANPHFVVPGNPKGSRLFTEVADQRMPDDWINARGNWHPVTEQDIVALAAWIDSLKRECDPAQFVNHTDMMTEMAEDLEKEKTVSRQRNVRYFTLTNLKNACISEKELKVYRQATIKLLNSLSRSPDVVRLQPIDEGSETILKVYLDDLGWDEKDWDTLMAAYPYNTQPETNYTKLLTEATGSKMPYVRADWFAFTASRPGMYEKLLKLPDTFQELAKQENVDIDANIKNFLAQRSGFRKSGVSVNNRMIERHRSRHGYFWTSYDFAGTKGKQDLYDHPLGPGGANGFEHDGGESIWSLPNGFQAYYLNDAKGKSLKVGPVEIVKDHRSKFGVVTNGISCMGCHENGMIKKNDEIRKIVLESGGKPLSRADMKAVDALYVPIEQMEKLLAGDTQRFINAMIKAGLDPKLQLNGTEMITALSQRYEADLDLALAAADLGLEKEVFSKTLNGAVKPELFQAVRRLQQNTLPRDQFENRYRDLMEQFGDEVVVVLAAPEGEKKPEPQKVKTEVDLSLTSDKLEYKVGEAPFFTVVSTKDCFLTLTNIDEKDTLTVLLPNAFDKNNFVKANVPFKVPGQKPKFIFEFGDKGKETVMAVCTEKAVEVDGIKHDFKKEQLTTVKDATRALGRKLETRAIRVKPNEGGGKVAGPAPAKKEAAPAADIKRTAITVQVR